MAIFFLGGTLVPILLFLDMLARRMSDTTHATHRTALFQMMRD